MIKLRNAEGKCFSVAKLDMKFVEICDQEGNIAALVYMPDNTSVSLVQPGDIEFERYIRRYKLTKTNVISLK